MKKFRMYLKVWAMTANNALQEAFINRWTNLLFIVGKLLRLSMSLIVLLLLKENLSEFGQYSTDQIIVFFLTYQFVDLIGQIFYRGVYNFGQLVRTGEFDFFLMKPISPLFRALTGKPDINDVVFLIPTFGISFYILQNLNISLSALSLFWFGILLINSFLIVTALHIFVLVMGVLTTEVDGVVWLYRDVSRLGQFPVSIYVEPLRFLLFFLVPIGVMMTIPSEVLLGLQPSYSIVVSFSVGCSILLLSFLTWSWALKRYSSASS